MNAVGRCRELTDDRLVSVIMCDMLQKEFSIFQLGFEPLHLYACI